MGIMDKIQKLFALAGNNPDREEAEAALLKAQALMAKYNIKVAEQGNKKEECVLKVVEKHARLRNAARNRLIVIIAKAFAVKCIIYMDHPAFFGYTHNAEAAASAFVFCANAMHRGGSKAGMDAHRSSDVGWTYAYNSYTLGFMDGLKAKFDEQCKALMIVVPQEVTTDFNNRFTPTKTCRRSRVHGGRANDIYTQGYADGRSAFDSWAIKA